MLLPPGQFSCVSVGTKPPCWELASSRPLQCHHHVWHEENAPLSILLMWTGIREKHPWQLQEGAEPNATKPVMCFEPTQLSRPWENPWHREPKGDPAHFAGAACSQLGEEIMRSIQGWNGWGWAPIESEAPPRSPPTCSSIPIQLFPTGGRVIVGVECFSEWGFEYLYTLGYMRRDWHWTKHNELSRCWDGFKSHSQSSFQDISANACTKDSKCPKFHLRSHFLL